MIWNKLHSKISYKLPKVINLTIVYTLVCCLINYPLVLQAQNYMGGYPGGGMYGNSMGSSMYGGSMYGGNQMGRSMYGGSPMGGSMYGGSMYGGSPMGGSMYGNNSMNPMMGNRMMGGGMNPMMGGGMNPMMGGGMNPMMMGGGMNPMMMGGGMNNSMMSMMMMGGLQNQLVNSYSQGLASQTAASQTAALTPQTVASKYFPQCQVAAAIPNMPKNVCTTITSISAATTASTFERLANSNISFYNQMLTEGQNAAAPKGIQCLKESQKRLQAEMQNKVNNLQLYINSLGQQIQNFKNNAKAQQDKIKGLYEELTGSADGDESIITASQDFRKQFDDPACREVLSSQALSEGGLRGIRDSITKTPQGSAGKSLRDLSTNLLADQDKLKSDLDKQIARIEDKINTAGIDNTLNILSSNTQMLTTGGLTNFKQVNAVLGTKLNDFELSKKQATGYLKDELGYDLPPFDSNFNGKINNFSQDAKNYFEKKYIDNCATGSGQGALGISDTAILAGLQQRSTKTAGSTTKTYQRALKQILDKDMLIQDKLSAIQALDNKFGAGNITITLDIPNEGRQILTPTQVYQRSIEKCQLELGRDTTYSANSPASSSYKNKVEKGQQYIRQMQDLSQNFMTDLSTKLKDEIINCDSRGTGRSGQCNSSQLSPEGENFCMKISVQCASNVQSCANKAETIVKDREVKMATIADQYNAQVDVLMTQQQQILDQVKTQVLADAEFFRQYFPGSKYTVPDSLFIKKPTKERSKYGVDMYAAGETNIFDAESQESLMSEVKKLQETLKQQIGETDKFLTEYIGGQAAALAENLGAWTGIQTKCAQGIDQYKKQMAMALQRQQAMTQNQLTSMVMAKAHQDHMLKNVCNRYEAYVSDPGGCKGGNTPIELARDMKMMTASINPSAINYISDIASTCKDISDGGETSDQEDIESKATKSILHHCLDDKIKSARNVGKKLIRNNAKFIAKQLNTAHDEEDFTEQEIKKYLLKQYKGEDVREKPENIMDDKREALLKSIQNKDDDINKYAKLVLDIYQTNMGNDFSCKEVRNIFDGDHCKDDDDKDSKLRQCTHEEADDVIADIYDKKDSDKGNLGRIKSAIEDVNGPNDNTFENEINLIDSLHSISLAKHAVDIDKRLGETPPNCSSLIASSRFTRTDDTDIEADEEEGNKSKRK